ncbi:MAG: NUDIX hydrolase [Acholeplasmataceae bacterium]
MIIKAFNDYQPKNEQEAQDQKLILSFLKTHDDALERSNLFGHVTSSAFILNQSMDRIIFAYHKIYDSWAWVGGHADGNPDLLEVAIKEAKEETGLKAVTPFSKDIFTIDVIYVKNHIKYGHYVPDHLHLNATYLLIADDTQPLFHQEAEHLDVRWFDLDDVLNHVSETRMIPIYQKALDWIRQIKRQS